MEEQYKGCPKGEKGPRGMTYMSMSEANDLLEQNYGYPKAR